MAKSKPPTAEQIQAAFRELQGQTDRGAAVIAGSMLEEMLRILLVQRMTPLSNRRHDAIFGKMAPLSSFSAKIEMALALGVITENFYYQLHAIREVRNRFAHQIEGLTFDHPDIQKAMHVARSRSPKAVHDDKSDFMLRFLASAYMLGISARDDIRIKTLSETHADEFERINSAVTEYLLKTVFKKATDP
jgi:DNA-binding MltR family transcriptional regulator